MNTMKFKDVKKMWARVYGPGIVSDDEEDCIFCPECAEPLYEIDWPEFVVDAEADVKDGVQVFCPVCEMSL